MVLAKSSELSYHVLDTMLRGDVEVKLDLGLGWQLSGVSCGGIG